MKNPLDPRHRKRQQLVEELFMFDFHKQKVSATAKKIFSKKTVIDEFIKKIAPQFPVDKINRIDLAILRLAIYELMIDKSQPPSVIIDESIELAKEYGGETSPQFINGALGNLPRRQGGY